MSERERQEALRNLETIRQSRVLVYVLSDRRIMQEVPVPGMRTQLGGEAYPFIFEHLRAIGRTERLDLVLHTSGGQVDSVWPLVQLCRSFATERFAVIVPLRALSSGTLLCLGADEIVMTDAAQLSPVDPTTQNAFNPQAKDGPRLPISVEDVTSYFQLATDKGEDDDGKNTARAGFGLKSDDHALEVFRILAQQVHPLALGNVKRVHTQIRILAKQLLELHLTGEDNQERIKLIVRKLTQELFSHSHMINRPEATRILGDHFVSAPQSAEEDAAIWALFHQYEDFFGLHEAFSVKEWLGNELEKTLDSRGGLIESINGGCHLYGAGSKVRQMSEIPGNVQVQLPPGQPMPLIRGLPTAINIEPIWQRWYAHTEA